MKRAFRLGFLLLAIAAAGLLVSRRWTGAAPRATTWRTATVQRGDIAQLVSATGTLSALTTVAVGARRRDIQRQFLLEAIFLSGTGDLLGVSGPQGRPARFDRGPALRMNPSARLPLLP